MLDSAFELRVVDVLSAHRHLSFQGAFTEADDGYAAYFGTHGHLHEFGADAGRNDRVANRALDRRPSSCRCGIGLDRRCTSTLAGSVLEAYLHRGNLADPYDARNTDDEQREDQGQLQRGLTPVLREPSPTLTAAHH